jgi:hypothetical protein
MVAWNASMWSASGISTKPFSVSARMRHYSGGDKWWLTCVYKPPREGEKDVFVAELHKLRTIRTGPWLLTGDFNMIYIVEDKNNVQLNRRLMGCFYHFLNDVSLKEIHLQGRLFTWSNERLHPTLEMIDRAFVSEGGKSSSHTTIYRP